MIAPATKPPSRGDGKVALMAATVEVVAAKGLRGMTFRAVAERAGVNNSLIAHHFGTRDALLAATLDWSVQRSIVVSGFGEFATADAYRDALIETLLAEPELQLFQFEMILESSRRPELRPAIKRMYDDYVAALGRSARAFSGAGVDPALDRAMFASLDGLVFQYLSQAITIDQLVTSVTALGRATGRLQPADQPSTAVSAPATNPESPLEG